MRFDIEAPAWITAWEVAAINAVQVQISGEVHFLRDEGLLLSALCAPVNMKAYEPERDLVELAVKLMAALMQNHPFEQGNKRTAFHAGLFFIESNGLFVELPDMDYVAETFTLLVTHKIGESDFVEFMRPFVIQRLLPEDLF